MVKKLLIWIVVAFAIYSIIATPEVAASAVRSAGRGGQTAIQAVLEFVHAISS